MKKNNVVTKMDLGEKAYGCFLNFPSAAIVELFGIAGFDFVHFDNEHGSFDIGTIDDLCRVADMAGLTPIARVPDIEASTILRHLDRGILGIMGPHITTRERAQKLVDACRYSPLGKRSFGSGRGAHFGQVKSTTEYMAHTNSQVLVIAQLEDVEVLDHLDEILSVDGIDIYASGPQDIAQSMGLPGQKDHKQVREFEATVRDAVRDAGKKWVHDVLAEARVADIIVKSAKAFLKNESP